MSMERFHELEDLRRSLAMLPPGSTANLTREEAMVLLSELQALDERLRRFRSGLERVLAEDKSC
jgi:hypothetical protein